MFKTSKLQNFKTSKLQLQVTPLLVEIILVCTDGKLVAGCLVAYDDCLGVHLEHGGSPLVGYVAVDDVLQGSCFVVAVAYE